MADSTPPANGADKRAQIIAAQAQREAAAGPISWRAARKRRPGPSWNTPFSRRNAPEKEAAAVPAPTDATADSKN